MEENTNELSSKIKTSAKTTRNKNSVIFLTKQRWFGLQYLKKKTVVLAVFIIKTV